jgi:nicotinamidase/pyrazinamidase
MIYNESMKKALIVVDVQKDFCPGGALAVPNGDQVVGPINKLIRGQFGRDESDIVVYSLDWHPKDHSSFKANGGIWPPHCIQDDTGAMLHDNLIMSGKMFLKGMEKTQDSYSAFGGLDNFTQRQSLDSYLKLESVSEVWVVGLALDYCVKATALDAVKLGYKTRLVLNSTRAVNVKSDDGNKAIAELATAGVEIVAE